MNNNNIFRNKVVWLVLFILLAAGSLLLISGCGGTEEPQTHKIAFFVEDPVYSNIIEGFKAGMADLGYVEGENITYLEMFYNDPEIQEDFSEMAPDYSNMIELNQQFVRKRFLDEQVDLVVTADSPTTYVIAMGDETGELPIVFTYATGTEAWEEIESYAQPGGRITGVTSGIDESTGKRMEILQKMSPDIKKVLWVYWPGLTVVTPTLELHRETADTLGLELVERPWDGTVPVSDILDTIEPGEVDAVFGEVATIYQDIEGFTELIERDRLPNISTVEFPAALAIYSVDRYKSGQQAARKADQILRGADPGSLPIEFPNKIELTIDMGVAQKLGLTIPEEVLRTADKVIPAEGGN